MADVFISFSSEDAERVEGIHSRLIERGIDVWWMRDVLPGDSPVSAVSRELASSQRVMLAWSRHAEQSPYVEGEMMYAFGKRKLLPVRIEKWSWPALMSSVQYVDMTPSDNEAEAWRQIDAQLQQKAQDLHAPQPRIAAPRSAGPVGTLAAAMLALALSLVAVLGVAYDAIRGGDMQFLELVLYSILALPVLSAALVLITAQRAWRAWRSRPRRVAENPA
jgi:hypothetical protein